MGILRYACPKCGEAFPWLIPRRQRMGFRFLYGAKISCSNCGQISRVKISIKNASWSWPLTVVLLFAFLPFLGKFMGISLGAVLGPLRDVHPALYAAVGGALGGIVGGLVIGLILAVGLRRGMEVVEADGRESPPSRDEKIQKWVEAMFPIVFALVVLLYLVISNGWAVMGWIVYGLGVAWAFYLIARFLLGRFHKRDGKLSVSAGSGDDT